MKLINIGFGSLVSAQRVLAVVSPESAPIKRVVQEAKERGMLIDASYGHKTKTVLLMDTDHVILSALTPDALEETLGKLSMLPGLTHVNLMKPDGTGNLSKENVKTLMEALTAWLTSDENAVNASPWKIGPNGYPVPITTLESGIRD